MDQHDFNRLKRYIYVFARGIFGVGAVFILSYMGITYLLTHLLVTKYRATAMIEIQPRPSTDPSTPATLDADSIHAEMEILVSSTTLKPVVQELDLVKIWSQRIFKMEQGDVSEKEAVSHLRQTLAIGLKSGTNILTITATSDLPQEAAEIANAVADQYKLERDADANARKQQAKQTFQEEIDQQQQVVEEKEDALEALRQSLAHKGVSVSHASTGADSDTLQSYPAARRDLDRQRALLDAFIQHLRQASDEFQLEESPVRIMMRAEAPPDLGRPNEKLERIVTILISAFLAVSIASSMEILLLLARASERLENY